MVAFLAMRECLRRLATRGAALAVPPQRSTTSSTQPSFASRFFRAAPQQPVRLAGLASAPSMMGMMTVGPSVARVSGKIRAGFGTTMRRGYVNIANARTDLRHLNYETVLYGLMGANAAVFVAWQVLR